MLMDFAVCDVKTIDNSLLVASREPQNDLVHYVTFAGTAALVEWLKTEDAIYIVKTFG